MRKLVQAVLLVISLSAGSLVHAAIVTWNLVGVTFNDGTQAEGFFTLDDSVSGFLSHFDITTFAGTLPAFHYDPANSPNRTVSQNGITLSLGSLTGFGVFGASDLFNQDSSLVLGGTIPLTNISFEGLNGVFRNVTSGSITAVPEPSALAFLAIGIGLFALVRFAQSRS